MTELIVEGWSGMALHETVSLLLPSLAFVVAAFAMANEHLPVGPRA